MWQTWHVEAGLDDVMESVGKDGIEHHCASLLRRTGSLVVRVSHLVSS